MKRLIATAFLAFATAAVPAVMANAQPVQQHCAQGQKDCKGQQQGQKATPANQHGKEQSSNKKAEPAKAAAKAGPKVGDSGRNGRKFERTAKMPKPGAHQEYRVIDDHVVRVDTQTQKVVAVLGLVSAFSK